MLIILKILNRRNSNSDVSHLYLPISCSWLVPRISLSDQYSVHSRRTLESSPSSVTFNSIDCMFSLPGTSGIEPANLAPNANDVFVIVPDISIVASRPTVSPSHRQSASPLHPLSWGMLNIPTNDKPGKDEEGI